MAKFKRKGKFPTWNVRGCEHISPPEKFELQRLYKYDFQDFMAN